MTQNSVATVVINDRQRSLQLLDAGVVFGIAQLKGFGVHVLAPDPGDPLVPAVDPGFVFDFMQLYELLKRHNQRIAQLLELGSSNEPVRFQPTCSWIAGPTQCGKTTLVVQFHARLNYPLVVFNGSKAVEAADMLSHKELIGGDTVDVDGVLLDAAQKGVSVLVNEADAIDPEQFVGFHDLFSDGVATVPGTGVQVRAKPGFAAFVCANTFGAGDMTGLYRGTQTQNAAFMDRFLASEATYPSPDVEAAIVKSRVTDIPKDALDIMINFANKTRQAFAGSIAQRVLKPMSTGSLIKWAREFVTDADCVSQGVIQANEVGQHWAFTHSLDEAYTRKLDPASRQAAKDIVGMFLAGGP